MHRHGLGSPSSTSCNTDNPQTACLPIIHLKGHRAQCDLGDLPRTSEIPTVSSLNSLDTAPILSAFLQCQFPQLIRDLIPHFLSTRGNGFICAPQCLPFFAAFTHLVFSPANTIQPFLRPTSFDNVLPGHIDMLSRPHLGGFPLSLKKKKNAQWFYSSHSCLVVHFFPATFSMCFNIFFTSCGHTTFMSTTTPSSKRRLPSSCTVVERPWSSILYLSVFLLASSSPHLVLVRKSCPSISTQSVSPTPTFLLTSSGHYSR